MGILKKAKKSFTKWKAEAPARDKSRLEALNRRLAIEKQRANILRQKSQIAKAQSDTRMYSQKFRSSSFGGAMSTQPSGIMNQSYFAKKAVPKVGIKVAKVKPSKKKRRKKSTSSKPKYVIRGGKAYPIG